MATPHTNTDSQEDTESVGEHEDTPTTGKEKKSVGHKILNSKGMRRLTGGRKLASSGNAVAPDKEQSPSRVTVTSSRRQSNTMSEQSRQAATKKGKQHSKQQQQHVEKQHYAMPPAPGQHDPPPQGPFFQPERPSTSPLVTSTTAEEYVIVQQPGATEQHSKQSYQPPVPSTSAQLPPHLVHQQTASHHAPAQSLVYDRLAQPAQRTTAVLHQPDHTHQRDEEEGDHCHDDPPSVERVQQLELENMRLKREKIAMDGTLAEYEKQILAKDREIKRMRKPNTSPQALVPSGVSEKETKLEMSLIDRTAQLNQCTAEKDLLQQDKDVLQQEFYELQAKYKALETEKQTAIHQVTTATYQAEAARNERAKLEEDITNIRKQLEQVAKEKKELVHSSQEQRLKERVKQLEDEKRGMDAERKASEDALRKQCDNNQKQLEKLLKAAQEEIQLLKTNPVEQQLREQLQVKLEQSDAKVAFLEETKREVQNELDEERKKLITSQQENAEQMAKLGHELDEEKRKVAELTRHEKVIAEQRREVEKLKQELGLAQQEVAHVTEKGRKKKEKYRTKLAEALEQQKVQLGLARAMNETADNEARLQQQLAERDEENRKIRQRYEIRLAELQQQLHVNVEKPGQEADDGSQTTGGAGASPLTSLEDKRKTVELQLEELTVKDQQLAGLTEDLKKRDLLVTELREKLHKEELLSKQLGTSVSHLESDLKKTTIARDELYGEVKILRATLSAKEVELHRMAVDSHEIKGQITSMADSEEQSSQEVLRLREVLKEKGSQLDSALKTLDRATRVQQSLENEKAHLADELQEREKSIESLHRRLKQKESAHKKERDEADRIHAELENKLMEQVKERSELAENFQALKTQHVKLVEVHSEIDHAVNSKQRLIEDLRNDLAIAQAQATTYHEDFQNERKDREAKHAELQDLKEQSATQFNRLETRIRELENQRAAAVDEVKFQQLQEDYQISQSQIIAYKKQMDISKREAEEEKRKVEEMRKEVATRQSQIEELGRQLDSIMRVAEEEKKEMMKESDKKQTRIDGMNHQMRLLATEIDKLKRAASNAEMLTNRADRLQNELDRMAAQYRELERQNIQLKHSNQVLLARVQQGKPQSHQSPPLDHTPLPGQYPVAIPHREHERWQQPNPQQAFQDQQEQLYHQQQLEQHHRKQEVHRQLQHQEQQRQGFPHHQQEQGRPFQHQEQRRQPEVIPHQESSQPPLLQQPGVSSHHHSSRPYYDDMFLNANAAPPLVPQSMDSLPSLSTRMGQQHQFSTRRGVYFTSDLSMRPNSQQPTPAQLMAEGQGGQGQGPRALPEGRGQRLGRGAAGGGHPSPQSRSRQAQQQQPPISLSQQPVEYSKATAESSSKHDSDTSDVAENPLIENIDRDMIEAQREVHKMYDNPAETIEGAGPDDSFEIPYDPNLICPKCGRQFRRGEIQKLRKHHNTCQE